jgi:hypothetical protein
VLGGSLVNVSKEQVKVVVHQLCSLSSLASVISFVASTYIRSPALAIGSDTVLKPEAVKAFLDIDRRVDMLQKGIENPSNSAAFDGTILSEGDLSAWAHLARSVNSHYKMHLMTELVRQVDLKAAAIKVPPYSHILNDSLWIRGQCSLQLLKNCDRVALSAAAGQLHVALFNASQHFNQFKLDTEPIDKVFEQVAAAKGLFDAAKQCVVIISHLHVCQSLTGDEQLREAEKLDQRDAPVPKCLKEHVKMLALKFKAKTPPPQAPAKRRKLAQGSSGA